MPVVHVDIDPRLNELAEQVIASAIEVHRHLGPGFLESTYHRALAIELRRRGVSFTSEVPVTLTYKDEPIGDGRIDMLVDGALIVELKAVEGSCERFRRQVALYLRASGHTLALLLNFHGELMKDGILRVVHTHNP